MVGGILILWLEAADGLKVTLEVEKILVEEVEGWRLETGDWSLETVDWRLEIGDWRLEIGDWRLVTGDW